MDDKSQKYLDEKFLRVFDKLDVIEEQVKKTNGKVQRHEEIITEALVERSANRAEHRENLEDIHCLKEKQQKTDDDLMEYRFLKRYPKAMLYMSAVVTLLVLYSVLQAFNIF